MELSFEDDAGYSEMRKSDAVPSSGTVLAAVANNAATGKPSISVPDDAYQVPAVLSAGAGTIADADGLASATYTYQWYRVDADGTSNETAITGQTSSTYTLTELDVGKRIRVELSFEDDAGYSETRKSDAAPSSGTVRASPSAATGKPEITVPNAYRVPAVLSAGAGTIADANGLASATYTYQWYRVDADGTSNETAITGQTSSTYRLTASDVGKRIRVELSFEDDAGYSEMRKSDAVPSSGTVLAAVANNAATGKPSISVSIGVQK